MVVGCEDELGSLVGVIYDPNRSELFAAGRGAGAFLNGHPIHGSVCAGIGSSIAAFGPAWTEAWHDHRMSVSDRLLRRVAHGRQMGSLALDLAWTAAGRFDFFYYDTDLNPWDVAMRVVAEEAGLVVELLPPDVDSPGSLVAVPPQLREDLALILDRRSFAPR